MKKIFLKLRVGAVPLILCIALVLTGVLSIQTNNNLQGNARIINYTGIVRGATQRLIKKELNHVPDDKLIANLDNILTGLSNGSDEFQLTKLHDDEYLSLLKIMEHDWKEIKKEITNYRNGAVGDTLFKMSEDYFDLANRTVLAAEVYSEGIVQDTRDLLITINMFFILSAMLCIVLTYYQDKRRRDFIEKENDNKQKSEQLTKQFQELLASINEITELTYVSDVDTYDLLFVNDAGKKMFNITEHDTRKCYEALQGFDAPCSFCPNAVLSKDATYSWEYTNPLTKGHYLLKDRLLEWEGRPAKMEIAFDITEATNEKIELKNRLERDTVLVECIRELYINHNTKNATTNVLQQVGKLFSAERAYIFLFHDTTVSNISEWCKADVLPQIDNLQNLPITDFAIWLKAFENQENVAIRNIEDLKGIMQAEYEFIKKQGITRMIMVPLLRDDKLTGCIGLDNLSLELFNSALTFLETLSYFIMLAMHRNENEEALYHLSYLDTLTSFYNRNRYIQDISDIEQDMKSVGVAYIDVNGLKEINDHFGHDMGDDLLKRCAEIIRISFEQGTFYRIGGDEFVIICRDIKKAEFDEDIRQLKVAFAQGDCKAAIGYQWSDTSTNIETIIKLADELMYEDKKEFYHNNPITERYRHYNDGVK